MVTNKKGVRHAFYMGILAAICMLVFPAATHAAGSKVILMPNTPSVSEGGSQTFTLQLTQPIVISDMTRNYVHLNVTSSDPSRISVTPNPIEYLPTDWWQQRSFTVSALSNANYGDTSTVTITVTADSGSAYYDLYTVSVPLTITDTTPAPPVVPVTQVANATANAGASTATQQPQLVDTGLDITGVSLIAVLTLSASLAIRLFPRKPDLTD